MNIFALFCGVFCAIFVAKCEDIQNVEQRLLDTKSVAESASNPGQDIILDSLLKSRKNTSPLQNNETSDISNAQFNDAQVNTSSALMTNSSTDENVKGAINNANIANIAVNNTEVPQVFLNGTSSNNTNIIEDGKETLKNLTQNENSQPETNPITDPNIKDLFNSINKKEDSLSKLRKNVSLYLQGNETSDIKDNQPIDTERSLLISSLLRTNTSNAIKEVLTNPPVDEDQAPKVFPNSESLNGKKIIEGDKKTLELLIKNQNITQLGNNTNKPVDTEVKDLLTPSYKINATDQHPLEQHNTKLDPDKIDDETELIEDGSNTEDILRVHQQKSQLDPEIKPDVHGYMSAIIGCTLFVLVIMCYAALWSWRRYLENRYGSRTMLVNAEEFDDPDDMKHFSI